MAGPVTAMAAVTKPDSALIHQQLGRGYLLAKSYPDSAMNLYREAISLADSQKITSKVIASAKIKLANWEYYRGNTSPAISQALGAMEYYKQKGDVGREAGTMILVADILRASRLFDQAFAYLSDAQQLTRKLNDSLLLARVYNRVAATELDDTVNRYDSVDRHARLSLAIARSLKNDTLIYNNLNILGVLETYRKNYRKSLDYLNEANRLVARVYPEDEPLVLINMARNLYLLKEYDKAVELDKRAIQLADKFAIPQYVRLAAANLKDHYQATGDLGQCLEYTNRYFLAKEHVTEQQVLVRLKEFNNRLLVEKKENENQRLSYEYQLANSRLQYLAVVGAMLMILLLTITVFFFSQRRQKNRIRIIAAQLDQSNRFLNKFISVLAHDLRSPFNAILGFTEMLKNDAELTPDDKEMAISRLYSVSRTTFNLLEKMLEWSRIQSGSVKPVVKECNLIDLVEETIQVLEASSSLKNISIVFHSQHPVMVQADPDMILTVIRNILSNAIKFTRPGGKVEISAERIAESALIRIKDNGTGIPPSNLDTLFRPDQNYKSQGTVGEKGTGLGLILCSEYVHLHQGRITVTSEPGKGSEFTVELPA